MEAIKHFTMETYVTVLNRELSINEWAQERLVLSCYFLRHTVN